MLPSELNAISLPLDRPAQLAAAMRIVAPMRQNPERLLDWQPEAELSLQERQRWEVATSLALVQTLGTGDGGLESRAKACVQLYALNLRAPLLAVQFAERLVRSRMVMGATDVETFWMCATFAHALVPVSSDELRRLTWEYLCHAPFAIDLFGAARFAQLSRSIPRNCHPRWPLELIERLMEQPAHADLGEDLLEALLCQLLKARSIEEVAQRLRTPLPYPLPPLLLECLHLLARHYVVTGADQVYAREVIVAASKTAADPKPYETVLDERHFDLPYAELYRLASDHIHRPKDLDEIYRRYVLAGQLQVARRLVECELVRRLDPWRLGKIHKHVQQSLFRVLAGADLYYPRVRELATRMALLCARTRFYTPESQHLVQRVLGLPQYVGPGAPLEPVREELLAFLEEADPRHLLDRERALIRERWDELTESEQRLIEEAQSWMGRHLPLNELEQDERRQRASKAGVLYSSLTQAPPDPSEAEGLESSLNTLLWQLYRQSTLRPWTRRVKSQIDRIVGGRDDVSLNDPGIISALARSFAFSDQTLAAANGAIAGLVGGPWGLMVDMGGLLALSARASTRIGACFGIEPGSPEGFNYLLDALTLTLSPRSGDGLFTWLLEQRPRAYRMVTVGGILYTTGATRRALRRGERHGHGGRMAQRLLRISRLLGLGLRERQWARMLPIVGAVIAAGADYLFMRELTEASLHLAARHWVLSRHGLLVPAATVADEELDADEPDDPAPTLPLDWEAE